MFLEVIVTHSHSEGSTGMSISGLSFCPLPSAVVSHVLTVTTTLVVQWRKFMSSTVLVAEVQVHQVLAHWEKGRLCPHLTLCLWWAGPRVKGRPLAPGTSDHQDPPCKSLCPNHFLRGLSSGTATAVLRASQHFHHLMGARGTGLIHVTREAEAEGSQFQGLSHRRARNASQWQSTCEQK